MGCNCQNTVGNTPRSDISIKTGILLVKNEEKIKPTDPCIACAQKHFDEAWIAFNECGYADSNRRFIRGSLRAVVLHTYKDWEEIGNLARECALLIQEAMDDEARPKMERLGELIDEAFYEANPEVKNRLEIMQNESSDSDSAGPR